MTPEQRAESICPWTPGEAAGICAPSEFRDKIADAIREAEARGAAREREACIKEASYGGLPEQIIAAIRARADSPATSTERK